ncbi:MAG: sulfotransferase domain-containing protein [Caulobacteraceae bacterium]
MDPVAFLAEAGELKLVEFLASRGPRAHIIAPEPVLAAIQEANPELECSTAEDWRKEVGGADNIFIYDDAPGFPSSLLRRRFPKKKIHVINYDVTLQLVCRSRKLNTWTPEPEHRLGILATPRSGSTFLGNLLTQLGLGHPIEHVRTPVVQLVKGGYPFEEVMGKIETIDSRNEVFGTKFISTFVMYVFGKNGAWGFAEYLKAKRYKLVRLERNLVDQAVSSYFAAQTNRWHLYKEKANAPEPKVEYDFAEIKAVYDRFYEEDAFLDEVLTHVPPEMVHRVDYAVLEADPKAASKTIQDFVGVKVPGAKISLDKAPKKISAKNKLMADYRERFSKEIAAETTEAVE